MLPLFPFSPSDPGGREGGREEEEKKRSLTWSHHQPSSSSPFPLSLSPSVLPTGIFFCQKWWICHVLKARVPITRFSLSISLQFWGLFGYPTCFLLSFRIAFQKNFGNSTLLFLFSLSLSRDWRMPAYCNWVSDACKPILLDLVVLCYRTICQSRGRRLWLYVLQWNHVVVKCLCGHQIRKLAVPL